MNTDKIPKKCLSNLMRKQEKKRNKKQRQKTEKSWQINLNTSMFTFSVNYVNTPIKRKNIASVA